MIGVWKKTISWRMKRSVDDVVDERSVDDVDLDSWMRSSTWRTFLHTMWGSGRGAEGQDEDDLA